MTSQSSLDTGAHSDGALHSTSDPATAQHDGDAIPVAASAIIREATPADVSRIVDMGQQFAHVPPYQGLMEYSAQKMTELASWLIANDDGLVLVAEHPPDGALVGMMGLLIFSHHLSVERIAGEVFWWVEPAHRGRLGLRLLSHAEAWAIRNDVARVQMITPTAEIGKIYEHRGYALVEISYQRSLR